MRWLRRALVALLLVAPVLVVAAVARPDDADRGGGDRRREGGGPDGEVVAGDRVPGELGFGEVARYEVLGFGGDLRIGVTGAGVDLTLTVVDGDGDEIAENDDMNGLDPAVTITLGEGETATIEVRERREQAAAFTLTVDRFGELAEEDVSVTTTVDG